MSVRPPTSTSLLVIGHPGHEFRIWGWLCAARPSVCVLTDGSGATGHMRADATATALRAAGAQQGSVFGQFSDVEIYGALLDHRHEALVAAADAIATSIVHEQCDLVVSDAIEGYNPTHDVCRLVTDAAVAVAGRRGQAVRAFEFGVVADLTPAPEDADGVVRHDLDDDTLDRKLALALDYARAAGTVLEREVTDMLRRSGREAFRREWLVPARRVSLAERFAGSLPFYETHGEHRVSEGKYAAVLRLQQHLLPLETTLRAWSSSA